MAVKKKKKINFFECSVFETGGKCPLFYAIKAATSPTKNLRGSDQPKRQKATYWFRDMEKATLKREEKAKLYEKIVSSHDYVKG